MAMYRLLRNLAFGERIVRRGSIKKLGIPEDDIAILLERGAIAPVSSPPIEEIPMWEGRAVELEEIGIVFVEHLLEANEAEVAEHMGTTKETIQKWKEELARWLQPPPLETDK